MLTRIWNLESGSFSAQIQNIFLLCRNGLIYLDRFWHTEIKNNKMLFNSKNWVAPLIFNNIWSCLSWYRGKTYKMTFTHDNIRGRREHRRRAVYSPGCGGCYLNRNRNSRFVLGIGYAIASCTGRAYESNKSQPRGFPIGGERQKERDYWS